MKLHAMQPSLTRFSGLIPDPSDPANTAFVRPHGAAAKRLDEIPGPDDLLRALLARLTQKQGQGNGDGSQGDASKGDK